jgi:hypothetical protein
MTVMWHACRLFMSICRIRAWTGVGLQSCRRIMPRNFLTDVANDYAVQQGNLDLDLLRGLGDPKLAGSLEAWQERSALPEPVWPEW